MAGRLSYQLALPASGDTYVRLIGVVSPLAGAVGVVLWNGPRSDKYQEFLDEAAPWLTDQSEVFEYPGGISRFPYKRNLYGASAALVGLLTKYANCLYEWDFPELPSDLFFLRPDGSTLLGSVASEDHSYLVLEESEAAAWLADWPASLVPLI